MKQILKPLLIFIFVQIFVASGKDVFAEGLSFIKEDRILIIAPHPDDEAVGTAGVIQSALRSGAKVKILYLTHGDYNEISSIFYQKKPLLLKADFIKSGQIRKTEATRAMSTLGLKEDDLVFLGYPDFGTMTIWKKHWGENKPFTNFPTGLNKVPYENDFSYGKPYLGDSIVEDIKKVTLDFKPTQVFVTPPFDLNSDHRAAYLYLNLALFELQGQFAPPKVYLYLVHAQRWPTPRKFIPTRPLDPPKKIEAKKNIQWIRQALKSEEVIRKKEALWQYKSQLAYSRNFLLSFVRANELFLEITYEEVKRDNAPTDPEERKKFNDQTPGEEVEYKIHGSELWVDAKLSSPLDRISGVGVEVFCYKQGKSFSAMPKLSFNFFTGYLFARDGTKSLYRTGIFYKIKKNKFLARIPLALLEDSDAIFVSTHAVNERLSLDFGSWRILKIGQRKN